MGWCGAINVDWWSWATLVMFKGRPQQHILIPGYTNYSPPEYELCVKDCDEALNLDRT